MSKIFMSGLVLSVLLAGCATTQENPNYKFSSKYESADSVQQVARSAPSTVQTASYNQTYTSPAASSSVQNVTYQNGSTAPRVYQSQRVYQAQVRTSSGYLEDARIGEPTPSQPAPTDQQYVGETLPGTPGYGVFIPEEVDYNYNQNIVSANSDMPFTPGLENDVRGFGQSPTLSVPSPVMQGNYTVKQGDTMYSLARNLCVGLDFLAQSNNIGSDYAIKIGQPLSLPASQC